MFYRDLLPIVGGYLRTLLHDAPSAAEDRVEAGPFSLLQLAFHG